MPWGRTDEQKLLRVRLFFFSVSSVLRFEKHNTEDTEKYKRATEKDRTELFSAVVRIKSLEAVDLIFEFAIATHSGQDGSGEKDFETTGFPFSSMLKGNVPSLSL